MLIFFSLFGFYIRALDRSFRFECGEKERKRNEIYMSTAPERQMLPLLMWPRCPNEKLLKNKGGESKGLKNFDFLQFNGRIKIFCKKNLLSSLKLRNTALNKKVIISFFITYKQFFIVRKTNNYTYRTKCFLIKNYGL